MKLTRNIYLFFWGQSRLVAYSMKIPEKLPGLKWGMILLGIYTAVWISLEGELWRVIVMGVGGTTVSMGAFWQKYLGGRKFHGWRWLLLTSVSGIIIGLGSSLLTLLFMSLKTGLHAHGPEFTPTEILWLIRQIPIWSAAGLLAGLGVGMLAKTKASF